MPGREQGFATGRTMLHEAGAMHQRAIDRGDIAKVPDINGAEVLGVLSYIASIPGGGIGMGWTDLYQAVAHAGQGELFLRLLAQTWQFGYLRALDDIQTERIGV